MEYKGRFMWERGVYLGGRHYMDMMPLLRRKLRGRLVTAGPNGAAAAAAVVARLRRKIGKQS